MNLFVLNEIITNGMNYNALGIISLISITFGILVIVSKNPIVSVLFLIGLFMGIAGYLMMLGINFIGLSYLLVYVGAVSILFIFILMLINVRISELVTENNNSVPLAIIIIGLVSTSEYYAYNSSTPSLLIGSSEIDNVQHVNVNEHTFNINNINDNLFTAISSNWDAKLSETSHITTIGNIIYTNYPMWLILTSIILLLAMVGSILITIKQ